MNSSETQTTSQLPSYIANASPNPRSNRAPWYKNTAPTYAGIFLWFVFWQDAAKSGTLGGTLSQGLLFALVSVVISAFVCHYLFYLVPGLLGQKTGLPLYIVGTSTFGAAGGFIMPGFLMGVLQFGWLGVNIFFSSLALAVIIPVPAQVIMVVWGILAAFVGLKGIQYVAKVATYLPLIPLAVLVVMLLSSIGGLGQFTATGLVEVQKSVAPTTAQPLTMFAVLAAVLTYVVGFFATAGAAGVDFGTNSVDEKDVSRGGLVGIALAIILTAGISMLVVAGVNGSPTLRQNSVTTAKAAVADALNKAEADALKAGKTLGEQDKATIANDTASGKLLSSPSLIPVLFGDKAAGIIMFLLAIAAFPPACFSSFIAANSFKTTLPGVNPFVSVGIGTAVSIILALMGWAGDAVKVFVVIGASFGPICGAMMVDYLMNNSSWSGPRSGFNPAGWIAWALGFLVGILPNLKVWFGLNLPDVPAAPVAAFIVGAVVYYACAKAGMLSPVMAMPARK